MRGEEGGANHSKKEADGVQVNPVHHTLQRGPLRGGRMINTSHRHPPTSSSGCAPEEGEGLAGGLGSHPQRRGRGWQVGWVATPRGGGGAGRWAG